MPVENSGERILTVRVISSEEDFESLGIASFFEKQRDESVDWDEYFDVKAGMAS